MAAPPDLPDPSALCELVVTAPDRTLLAALAADLVEEGLAAAGHLSDIESIYRWEGMQHTTETRLALHTRVALTDAIVARIRARHPFQVPGIWTLPMVGGSPDYLDWIRAGTAAPSTESQAPSTAPPSS